MRFTRPRTRVAVAAAVCLLTVGAPTAYATLAETASTGSVVAPARGTPYIETRLLFGTERPDGGPAVTDEQFTAFVDREVTPGFPDGLTVQEGRGQWRDASGTIEKERSYELILLYPVSAAATSDRKIEEIRGDYLKEFAQEAVARVDDRTRVDF
ncbi:choline dehydrogenase [Streptomyces scabiei]|nr:choline dehydrogenase [Streptomyces scabiei]